MGTFILIFFSFVKHNCEIQTELEMIIKVNIIGFFFVIGFRNYRRPTLKRSHALIFQVIVIVLFLIQTGDTIFK